MIRGGRKRGVNQSGDGTSTLNLEGRGGGCGNTN